MSRRDFGRDTGLQARMLLTMFLLGLVYAVLIAVAVSAGAGVASVVVIAAVFFAIQLFASDKIALAAMGMGAAPTLPALRAARLQRTGKGSGDRAPVRQPNVVASGRRPSDPSLDDRLQHGPRRGRVLRQRQHPRADGG